MTKFSESYRKSHSSLGYGDHYSKTYEHGYYAQQWQQIEKPLLEQIFDALEKKDDIRYLDFACGTGRILTVAEKFFNNTTGVDISPEMLRVAKEVCKDSRLVQQDITKFPLQGEFDIITAFRFFLNAESALAHDVLSVFNKLLPERNGILILNIHVNRSSPLGMFYELRNKIKGTKTANTKSYREFRKILEDNNFEIEKVYWYSFLPRTGWYFDWIPKYMMLPIEKILQKVPFVSSAAQCFLVQCRKK